MFERTRSLWQRLTHSPAADDRRAWERYPSRRATVVLADAAAAPWTAHILDVSRGGIRLLVHQAVDEGAMIRIELPRPEGEPKASVLACVIHRTDMEPGAWVVGCHFSTELNDTDLDALGARRQRQTDSDKRTRERMPVSGRAVYREAGRTANPREAGVHNISPTGVALRVAELLEPGVLLTLELHGPTGAAGFSILACVVYISEVGAGEWLAGCTFIRELNDEELQKLL